MAAEMVMPGFACALVLLLTVKLRAEMVVEPALAKARFSEPRFKLPAIVAA